MGSEVTSGAKLFFLRRPRNEEHDIGAFEAVDLLIPGGTADDIGLRNWLDNARGSFLIGQVQRPPAYLDGRSVDPSAIDKWVMERAQGIRKVYFCGLQETDLPAILSASPAGFSEIAAHVQMRYATLGDSVDLIVSLKRLEVLIERMRGR